MLEKIGPVRNPLTIIAIFAGISEVCGSVVLPFIQHENQLIFIYFLISFPTLLVFLFFLTLNFNNKVLYSPSDYRDEENFLLITKFDYSKQSNIETKLNQSEIYSSLFSEYSEKMDYLSSNIKNVQETIDSILDKLSRGGESDVISQELARIKINYKYNTKVNNLNDANSLINLLDKKGYLAEIYIGPRHDEILIKKNIDHKSIWLGKNVPLEIASEVITISKNFYNHLEYIHISEDKPFTSPNYVHNEIFIGGATSTVKGYGLKPLSKDDFESIKEKNTLVELHKFIRTFYSWFVWALHITEK